MSNMASKIIQSRLSCKNPIFRFHLRVCGLKQRGIKIPTKQQRKISLPLVNKASKHLKVVGFGLGFGFLK